MSASPPPTEPEQTFWRRSLLLLDHPLMMAAAAFVIRAVLILTRYDLRPVPGLLAEYGCIATSIASGHGFSSPFCDGTGPTAWGPPVYPMFLAGIFKLFGINSPRSSVVVVLANAVFGAVTAFLIYRIGQRTLGSTTARWTAWAWALLPLFTSLILHTGWSTFNLWDTWLSAMLLALVFLVTLEVSATGALKDWAWLGVLWALTLLTIPTLLSFLPFSVGWIVFRLRRENKKSVRGLEVFAAALLLLIGPWLLRNFLIFRTPVFIQDSFGVILYVGNYPGADGTQMVQHYPSFNRSENEDFRRLGEPGYSADRLRRAESFIFGDFRGFVVRSLKRVVYFWSSATTLADPTRHYGLKLAALLGSSLLAWCGLILAIWRRAPGTFLFAALMATFPAVFYITFSYPRFRQVIEPELLLLAIYAASEMLAIAFEKKVRLPDEVLS